jgi:hypothetical protein
MSLLQNSNAISSGGYDINNSLRFRASASAYLSRTPASASNRKTWTWSGWVKRGALSSSTAFGLFGSSSSGLNNAGALYFTSDVIQFQEYVSGGVGWLVYTSAVFRDPSAWYHVVLAVDTTQATVTNGVKLYVNGVQQTLNYSQTGASGYTQNADLLVNSTNQHQIGQYFSGSYFDGYMGEVNFINGQALTPSSFGETDIDTGVWKPKAYTGTYGTNGFYLKFADASAATAAAIGKDSSGNSNNWTPNNISVTTGVTYDAMTDSPTNTSTTVGNYCTANRLDMSPTASAISNGNLTVNVSGSAAGGGYGGQARCNTIDFTSVSGKWYWEAFIDNAGTGAATLRLTFFMDDEPVSISAQSGPWAWYWRADGVTDLTSPGTFATNDVLMFAYDSATGKLWVGKNGTWSNSGVPASGTGQVKTLTALTAYALGLNYGTSGGGTGTASFNFGQRPFAYTPPTGFNRINTFNLPDSTIKKGNSYMDATTYTGTGASRSVTNAASFRPDFVWVKGRSGATDNALYDAVRGTTNDLVSNSTAAATTQAQGLTAFNSNGFTVGTLAKMNTNAATYVGWQWQAGSSTVTNTSGTVSAQVRANTTTGFSVCTFNAGSSGAQSFGHGLGVAPKMVIIKDRANAVGWNVYHSSAVTATNQFLQLNVTSATQTLTGAWGSALPTSTLVGFGSGTIVTANANSVAYCWAEIAGFSKFGSYTGNGSTDGPFVYTGFRPSWILIKSSSTASTNWFVLDDARNTYNLANLNLLPNDPSAELNNSTYFQADFLSNGFKLRSTGQSNTSAATYIYAAFAKNPFKNSLAR